MKQNSKIRHPWAPFTKVSLKVSASVSGAVMSLCDRTVSRTYPCQLRTNLAPGCSILLSIWPWKTISNLRCFQVTMHTFVRSVRQKLTLKRESNWWVDPQFWPLFSIDLLWTTQRGSESNCTRESPLGHWLTSMIILMATRTSRIRSMRGRLNGWINSRQTLLRKIKIWSRPNKKSCKNLRYKRKK